MTARAFDSLNSPLDSGATLIEASAGTGKTYTITAIVLRLILEEGLAVENILVTTYTELATTELRDRIRKLIRATLEAFRAGRSPNEYISALLARQRDGEQATKRLRDALQSFDEAPIYTIHGFCQRTLRDYAFESGAFFDAELIIDQSQILREMVDDFWRTHFYASDRLMTAFALKNKFTPERLLDDLQELVNKPTMIIRPDERPSKGELDELWGKLRVCWEERAPEVRAIFANLYWAKGDHGKAEVVAQHLADVERCLLGADGMSEELACLDLFAASRIARNTRAHHSPPKHLFFDLCEDLLVAGQELIVRLEAEFFAWARAEMKRRKIKRNVFSFDDLLTRLLDSLDGEGGNALARSIRERYPAALIDEFQDTDPIQYAIFRKIYADGNGRVFFIGDPKQAIYGFRGADVFTYITAAKAASHKWTLGKNWRSESNLVEAINTLFGTRPDAFVLEGILFEAVEAAGKADAEALTINGALDPPFHLWLLCDAEPVTLTDARRRLPKSVAGEIARLLNSDTKLGQRSIEPRDIAVLVATNAEAQMVQDALSELRIPSVVYGSANIFRSREARELECILAAVIEPAHERLVRAALATDALGLTSEELDALGRDERDWERLLLQFQEYHQLWAQRGFMQMLRTMLLEQRVRARLLSYPDGERRLTNLLHLAELLHRLCTEARLGMTGLRKRLGEEIKTTDAPRVEEHELRLERDERAVRVVTVHKSKGLEFGVVFCPFSWSSGAAAEKERHVVFHEGDNLALDLTHSEANQKKQSRERLADNVRRLYVALTRAEHRCYFVWGNCRAGDYSAPAHLLGDWQSPGIKKLSQVKSIAALKLPEGPAEPYRTPEEPDTPLQPRVFEGAIDRTYSIASFSRLISGYEKEPESPEDEEIEPATAEIAVPEIAPALTGMFAFPRGTGPGICLHQIFEELDFAQPDDLPLLVRQRLRAFNIREFDEVVCEMIGKVLTVPLRLAEPGFTLSRVTKEARLQELEFYFPIGSVKRDSLVKLFGDNRLQFQPMSGFMKGFIDLVFEHEGKFFIADWKSNWLGGELDDYAPAATEAEMTRKFYNLQLSIYTVALHRFLRARKPGYSYEQHFGGVFYLFVRGIEPSRPELGVHRSKPDATFIQQLDKLLSDRN